MVIQTKGPGDLFVAHRLTSEDQFPSLLALVHEAEHFEPDSTVVIGEGLNAWVLSPIADIELKGWEFQRNKVNRPLRELGSKLAANLGV